MEKISILIFAYSYDSQCMLHMFPLEILYDIIKKYKRQLYLRKLIRFYKYNQFEDFDWCILQRHPAINWDNLYTHLQPIFYDGYNLSRNPNITWDIICDNTFKMKWEWDTISKNPNITWDIVIYNINLPWNWYYLTKTVDIDFEKASFLKQNYPHLIKHLDWFYISKHPKTTWNVIELHSDLFRYWNSDGLSLNPNITIDIIKNIHVWHSLLGSFLEKIPV